MDKTEKELREQLSQTRALLSHTVDTLQEERRMAAATKNRVTGGYYMMSRMAEKNLRTIQRQSPSAGLVFSVIRENMQIGTNAVTISQAALGKILGLSRSTISRATKYLAENKYVHIVNVGNVSTNAVTESIAFAESRGHRKGVLTANVVTRQCVKVEGWEDVKQMKALPVIYEDERVILGSEELPPQDQTDLNLNYRETMNFIIT